ncbi:MAG: hypothetical protein MR727_10250, partial [Lentisphaeria bacterium]|nr:hypothetical protein [Lentisphaeria bacterium]
KESQQLLVIQRIGYKRQLTVPLILSAYGFDAFCHNEDDACDIRAGVVCRTPDFGEAARIWSID